MLKTEKDQPREVIEVPAQCYQKRAAQSRRLSYVRVQKLGNDGKRRTVFTFLWK
jgi:hypothetical protein